MGNKKPEKSLGIFLKDKKNTFTKRNLAKFTLAVGTVALGANMILADTVSAAHSNTASIQFVPASGSCYKLQSVHSNVHSNHSNHGNHSNY